MHGQPGNVEKEAKKGFMILINSDEEYKPLQVDQTGINLKWPDFEKTWFYVLGASVKKRRSPSE